MANVKITGLTAITAPANTDVLPIVDVSADVTKKVSVADLLESAGDGTAALPAFAFDSDKDIGMYRVGANQLGFATDATARLIIDSSGKVGIGTSSPSNMLHINGSSPSIRLSDTGANGGAFSMIEDNNGLLKLRNDAGNSGTGSGIAFDVDATEKMRIDSSGNVGIGTSSPSRKLQVNSSTTDTVALFESSDADCQINFQDSTSSADGVSLGCKGDNFYIRSGLSTERMRIDSSGRLLLGTTTEGAVNADTLTVAESGDSGITIRSGSTSAGSLFFSDATSGTAEYAGYFQYDHSANSFAIGTASSEALRIDSSGRVGIGTSSPEEILHIAAASESVNQRDGVMLQSTSALAADTGLPLVFSANIGGGFTNYGIASIAGRKENATSANAAGYLQFATGSSGGSISERMRIDSSGVLLINKSTTGSRAANAPLQIKSGASAWGINLSCRSNDDYSYFTFTSHDSTETLANILVQRTGASTGDLAFSTNNGTTGAPERMRITSSGNVGIGNSSPAQKLHVGGNIRFGANTSYYGQIEHDEGSTGSNIYTSNDSGGHIFKRNASEQMRINSSGRVGIGLTNPSSEFHVKGAGTVATFEGTGGSGFIGLKDSDDSTTAFIGCDAGSLKFQTSGSNYSDKLVIDSSGKVLIGDTTGGGANLNVYGTSSATIYQNSATGTGNGQGMFVGNWGSTHGYLYNYENADLVFGTNNTERMRIDSYGRIGIATTTTDWFSGDHKLVVRNNVNSGSSSCVLALQDAGGQYPFIAWNAASSGTRGLILFRVSGSGSVVGSITTNGSSTTYSTSSDYRLKENVIELSDGINRVKQLQPKRFNFIADASKTVDGFLAHEAETVVPEAVTGEKDGEDMQGLDLSKLVPLLTAALQESILEIEKLKKRVEDLEG